MCLLFVEGDKVHVIWIAEEKDLLACKSVYIIHYNGILIISK